MKRKLLSILLLCVLYISPATNIRFASAQATPAKWTLMVYMAANNNLEPNSIINLMEMAAVGSSPDVNLVVQITRPPDYKGFYGEWGGTRRFLVTKSDGGLSSGDFQISPARLAAYLTVVAKNAGINQTEVDKVTKGPVLQQEQVAIQMSVPVIEKDLPLTPLQLKNVQDLGSSVNSADAATLADFGTWAVQNYPAEHYGLILWDHGGGWSMIASDDTLGSSGIKMPDLAKALTAITAATKQKFDFIGFDACLMSQLAVAVTVKPFTNYEIGAEEVVPGMGWDYTPAIRALEANPALSVPDFAKLVIDSFATLYSTTEKRAAASFDMGLIDLTRVDEVVKALDAFDSAVKAAGGELKTIGTARSNVQAFGAVGRAADQADLVASVDLSDLMRLIGSLSTNADVKQTSKAVIDALARMVVYHKANDKLPGAKGVSIFFPANSEIFTGASGERYREEFGSTLPGWQSFLDTFYSNAIAAAQGSAPKIHITKVTTTPQQPGSVQDTPVISYSLNGKNVVSLTARVIYQINSTTSIIIDQFPVTSNITTADGSQVNQFVDGPSSNDFYWSTKLSQISDGTNKLLVLMVNNPKDAQHGYIRGIYTSQQTGKKMDVSLLIDFETYQSSGMWASQDNGAIAEVFPQPGDTFEPVYLVINSQTNAITPTPAGITLTFGKAPFQVNNVPGPDGVYNVVLAVGDTAGSQALDVVTVDVKNSGLDTSLQGFKDLGFGISFLYPYAWTDIQTFRREDGSDELYVTDDTGDFLLSAINYTDAATLADVQGKVTAELGTIDGIKIGQASDITVAGNPGTALPYQYTTTDGVQMVGTAVAVYVKDTNQGYQIRIEAPDKQLATSQKIFEGVLKSIKFFAPER